MNCWNIHKITSKLPNIRNIVTTHENKIIPAILSCFIASQLSFPINAIAESNGDSNNQKVYFGVGCFWVSHIVKSSLSLSL